MDIYLEFFFSLYSSPYYFKILGSFLLSDYGEIIFPHLIFMMNLTINLMNESYHKCERKEHHSRCFMSF